MNVSVLTNAATLQKSSSKKPGTFYYRAASKLPKDDSNQTTFGGVQARAFGRIKGTVPCFTPELSWDSYPTQMTPTKTGLLFLKTYKTGSSTASGIDLRIARNVAKRLETGHDVCKTRFDHAWASALYFTVDPKQSFLWTIVRNPTARVVSQLFHFHVSREGHNTTDGSLIHRIRHDAAMYRDYYLSSLSTRGYNSQKKRGDDPIAVANQIVQQYNFIAITERMDESAVALSMILNIPLADVLFLKAKGHGGYDAAGGDDGRCTYITPSFVSAGMEEYFRSDEYQDWIQWDYLLYQAANRSLDLTIDGLGRPEFQAKLARFRKAQEFAVRQCLPKTRFPCSATGEVNNETDCLWKDSGCGYACLDDVASELRLWT